MKILIEAGCWRLRIDEDELARLEAGDVLTTRCELPGYERLDFELGLVPSGAAQLERRAHGWRIGLPQAPIPALRERLPDREGIGYTLGSAFELRLQVDVKDSLKRRRPPG